MLEDVQVGNLTTASVHRVFFFFNDTATTEIYTLSLHDALPISSCSPRRRRARNRSARELDMLHPLCLLLTHHTGRLKIGAEPVGHPLVPSEELGLEELCVPHFLPLQRSGSPVQT